MTTKTIEMTAEDGAVVRVNVPTSLPSPERVALYQAAFNRVQNPTNWKKPIYAVVTGSDEDLKIIAEAIEFYTATSATITHLTDDMYRVTAPGYYAGPAN